MMAMRIIGFTGRMPADEASYGALANGVTEARFSIMGQAPKSPGRALEPGWPEPLGYLKFSSAVLLPPPSRLKFSPTTILMLLMCLFMMKH